MPKKTRPRPRSFWVSSLLNAAGLPVLVVHVATGFIVAALALVEELAASLERLAGIEAAVAEDLLFKILADVLVAGRGGFAAHRSPGEAQHSSAGILVAVAIAAVARRRRVALAGVFNAPVRTVGDRVRNVARIGALAGSEGGSADEGTGHQ